jgi:murein DD-endopeptidase MepM/ murein hydrolase activator NlpD
MQDYVFDPKLRIRQTRPRHRELLLLAPAIALAGSAIYASLGIEPARPTSAESAIERWVSGTSAQPPVNLPVPRLIEVGESAVAPEAAPQGPGSDLASAAAAPETRVTGTGDSGPGESATRTIAANVEEAPPANAGATSVATRAGEERPADTNKKAERETATAGRWINYVVKKGESLGKVLAALGIDSEARSEVIKALSTTKELASIKAGQKLRAHVDSGGDLLELQVPLGPTASIHVEANNESYEVRRIDRPVETRLSMASAVIQSSLFGDGHAAGLSDRQLMELAAIFNWEIDFALGLRSGDRFSVIYEAKYLEGKKVDTGPIVAAEFVNKGNTYRALRFEESDGTIGYYAPDGTSKKQAFIRTPIKLARVSSGFSLSRWHPVLQETRAHRGVDYAAPSGTPVKATGAGVVEFSGRQNGYGNVVMLQHGSKYTTVYGHLSRFAEGMKAGSKVKQGQVIGYVGQTGLATGPHLHYEFRVDGKHRDPLSIKLPTATPLTGKNLIAFKRKTGPLLAQLDTLSRTMVAAAR